MSQDEAVVAWAQTHAADDIEKVVAPYASRGGAFILDAQAKAHLVGHKCEIAKDVWEAIPLLRIDKEEDGVYAVVGGHYDTKEGGVIVFIIDGIYVGISFEAGTYRIESRSQVMDALRNLGYPESEIKASCKEVKLGGLAGRVTRNHLSPAYRERRPDTALYQQFDTFQTIKPILLFGSNSRRPTATADEKVYVALREHVGIVGADCCLNYSYASKARDATEELKLDPATVLRCKAKPHLQVQVGLEGRGKKDWSAPYISTSTTLRVELKQPQGSVPPGGKESHARARDRLCVSTSDTHLFGQSRMYLRPELDIPADKEQKVRVQVSFNKQGSRAAWDEMDPRRRLGPFGPIVPEDGEHPFLVLFVSAYGKQSDGDGPIVKTMTLHDASDPGVNSAAAYDRLYRQLYNKFFDLNQTLAKAESEARPVAVEGLDEPVTFDGGTFSLEVGVQPEEPNLAGALEPGPGPQIEPESDREPTTTEDEPAPPLQAAQQQQFLELASDREPTTEEDEPVLAAPFLQAAAAGLQLESESEGEPTTEED